MTADKFLNQEGLFNNKLYSDALGIDTLDLNMAEIEFLETIDYEINIDSETFFFYRDIILNDDY